MATQTENKSESTEVATIPPHAQDMMQSLGIVFTDTADVTWRIAARLATANTVDELLRHAGPDGLREHIGEPFYVRQVDYLRSAFEGSPIYAVIDAATPDGEPRVYTTGATSVVIQLARGLQQGWWDGVLVKAAWSTDQPTADGNRPYKLVKA